MRLTMFNRTKMTIPRIVTRFAVTLALSIFMAPPVAAQSLFPPSNQSSPTNRILSSHLSYQTLSNGSPTNKYDANSSIGYSELSLPDGSRIKGLHYYIYCKSSDYGLTQTVHITGQLVVSNLSTGDISQTIALPISVTLAGEIYSIYYSYRDRMSQELSVDVDNSNAAYFVAFVSEGYGIAFAGCSTRFVTVAYQAPITIGNTFVPFVMRY
jgi:hypothetical protein